MPQSYDTDGNILQAIDDTEIPSLLTQFFTLLSTTNPSPSNGLKITELGCGTGRNTSKLLHPPFISQIASIHGLDLSPEMLQMAQKRCSTLLSLPSPAIGPASPPTLTFHIYDALSQTPIPEEAQAADGIISTLVLEHLPLPVFFRTAASLLRKSPSSANAPNRPGYLLLTNMHSEMGSRSQAGFVDDATGAKVCGESFVYSVDEMLREAERWGFSLVGGSGVRERGVGEGDLEAGVVGKRGWKWVGCKVWFGCVLRFGGGAGLGEEGGEGV
jgi:SAM-dependent methyltransferase